MAELDVLDAPLLPTATEKLPRYDSKEAQKEWPVIEDKEALANLKAYKDWMLAEGSWIHDRDEVNRAFDIIEKDIPVSVGANGDVEDLVVGPALLKCYWCNAWTWSSFLIIFLICFTFLDSNQYGFCDYPTNWLAFPVFGVFFSFTFRAMWLEYQGAMYVLPAQAISSGTALREMNEAIAKDPTQEAKYYRYYHRLTFNEWAVCMLIISFLFHLDIASTAIFIARVLKSRIFFCQELDRIWAEAMKHSMFSWTPLALPYSVLVGSGTLVMVLQLLYAMSYSVPMSPNLAPVVWDGEEKTTRWLNFWTTPYRWCKYQMADVDKNEILDHPIHGKNIGEEGDWQRPEKHDQTGKWRKLNDCMLFEDAYIDEKPDDKRTRVNSVLERLQKENDGNFDNYEMRLARHRRARVAIFNTVFKPDMGYGRAVQALVESGRMNLMQWQDDLYLEQSEHNWGPWAMVKEIRRTNIRFFLFALQAGFFPFFQITYYGVVATHSADSADSTTTSKLSDWATSASVIISTFIAVKYLLYEFKSVRNHRKFFNVAIQDFKEKADRADSQRKQWEVVRLRRRKNFSLFMNLMLFLGFALIYLELFIKVVMIFYVCDANEKVFNLPPGKDMLKIQNWKDEGCVSIDKTISLNYGCNKTSQMTGIWPFN